MKIHLLVLDITYIGGIERVVANLSNYLSKKHEVTIVSCFKKKIRFFIVLMKISELSIYLKRDLKQQEFFQK